MLQTTDIRVLLYAVSSPTFHSQYHWARTYFFSFLYIMISCAVRFGPRSTTQEQMSFGFASDKSWLADTNFPQGDTDLVANFLGVKQVARAILWPGIDGFNVLANRPEASYEKLIDAENKVYGNYINFDRLMYARVFDAGHVINQNRPKESKNLLERWLAGENFGKSGREVVGKEEDL